MRKNIVIAIDGYSSCGKSTLAKALAKRLAFIYIDSGAMYRAVTLYFLRNKVDINTETAVKDALNHIELNFHARDYESHILLNGEEVSDEIRQMPVSENVSEVSANKLVRHDMVKQQQRMGKSKNIVMDGRDIGTAVFEDAQIKFFMTADPKIRAERRHKELVSKGDNTTTLEEVFENLADRKSTRLNSSHSTLSRMPSSA